MTVLQRQIVNIGKKTRKPFIDLNIKFIRNGCESTALSQDIENNKIEITILISNCQKNNFNIPLTYESFKERTPLSMAIEKNNMEIIQILLTRQN